MTEYVILKRSQDGLGWLPVRNAGGIEPRKARSAKAAIADTPEANEGGEFVAVPARSWKPVTVKVETKTALRFS
jgi:hypothetical protein